MSEHHHRYIPAAGHDWFLPLYDPVIRLLFREEALRQRMLGDVALEGDERVLDVGSGTGTFAILMKRAHPGCTVTGIDGDPKALAIARDKAREAAVDVGFDEGMAYALPYPDGAFDCVFSSLVFHHMARGDKMRALAEIRRVLAPGGRLVLVDFGPPTSVWDRLLAHVVQRGEALRDNVEGRLVPMMTEAGFSEVEEVGRVGTIAGSLWTHRTRRPA